MVRSRGRRPTPSPHAQQAKEEENAGSSVERRPLYKKCQVTCPHGGSAFLKRLTAPLTAALDIKTTIRSSRISFRSGSVCPHPLVQQAA